MASGDTLCVFRARDNHPPASNYAEYGSRNNHLTLEFSSGAADVAIFEGVMPQQYASSGADVVLFTASQGTTGDMDWDVAWENMASQDLDSDGFASAQSTDGTSVNGTSGVITQVTVSFTDGAQMDSVTAGNPFRIKVTRQGSDDSSSDILEIVRVEIREA